MEPDQQSEQDGQQQSTERGRSRRKAPRGPRGSKRAKNRSWGDYYANSDPSVLEHDQFISDYQEE